MKATKQRRLKKAGWVIGDTKSFLNLSESEMALIEIKRSLIAKIKEVRANNKLSQQTLAKLLKSSQSRVAKLEACEPGISLDLICKALITMGVSRTDIAKALAKNIA